MAAELPELRTERLRMRPPTLSDVARVAALYGDPRVYQHDPAGAKSYTATEARVRADIAGWERDGIGYWIVELDGRLAGVAGVMPVTLPSGCFWNVYYRFAPETWGLGIASEAVRAALAQAREAVPGRSFVVRTRPRNVAAIRLAERLGLTRASELDGDGFVAWRGV